MSRARQFLMAAGTFSVALGIGFVMQNGDALAGRFADEATVDAFISQPIVVGMPSVPVGQLPAKEIHFDTSAVVLSAPVTDLAETVRVAAVLPSDTSAPSFAPEQVDFDVVGSVQTASDAAPDLLALVPSEPILVEPACDATLIGAVTTAAMVDLVLTAPCSPDESVVIHHQGMMFTVMTDSAGIARIQVPALADDAIFVAELGDGKGAAASLSVPELAGFDRAVLQWQGGTGMELHALEFGAGYDESGHVWAGAARDAATAVSGQGGFVTQLGDRRAENARYAEVYTFPRKVTVRDGAIDLTVEAEVTQENCGQEVVAQSIQLNAEAAPTVVDLTMTMPDCNSVGEYLVLNDMLQDLIVAVN